MHKVAFITVTLQHYRLSFYEKLTTSNDNIEWVVYHGLQKNDNGRPAYRGSVGFRNEAFIEKSVKIGPFNIVYNKGLLRKIKEFDPEIIVLPGIGGNISNRRISNWGKRKNKKIILWTCGWEPGTAKGMAITLKEKLVSSFFKQGDFHLTYSTKASQYTESMGISPNIIETCYNGIEIDQLIESKNEIEKRSLEIRKLLKLDGYITFLYVGGLIPQKKVEMLVKSFNELRKEFENIKLLIIGDGPDRKMLEGLLEDLDDENIIYLGRIVEKVDDYFASADCFVMPGIGGLAINQAMFWGKVCIVSEADGTEDDLVIPDKTGFRFEKNSQSSLQDSMKKMLNLEKSEIEAMSKEARAIIYNLSNTNHMVEKFSTTVNGLLSEKNNA